MALIHHLSGQVGAEVSLCEQATRLEPDSPAARARLAHALARTDRVGEAIAAAERALSLTEDREVRDLLERLRQAEPAGLAERTAA